MTIDRGALPPAAADSRVHPGQWSCAATTSVLVVNVAGTPAPQGSKSFKGFRGGKAVLVESCTAVAPWRLAVVRATVTAMTTTGITTITGPIAVAIDFYLQRPTSAPKRRTVPDRRPDLDKLVRSTLDALTTAKVIEDDARIVEIAARKHYALSRCGARICVRSATAEMPE